MQPPAATLLGRRVAKNPIARPVACLDAVVIADQIRFAVTPPPFAVNALRPIGFGYSMTGAAPDKKPRRMVGQLGDGFNFFRLHEKPCRPRQAFWPIHALGRLKRRDAA